MEFSEIIPALEDGRLEEVLNYFTRDELLEIYGAELNNYCTTDELKEIFVNYDGELAQRLFTTEELLEIYTAEGLLEMYEMSELQEVFTDYELYGKFGHDWFKKNIHDK